MTPLLVTLLAAVAHLPEEPAPPPSLGPPLVAVLRGPSAVVPGELELILVIERPMPDSAPLELSVRLPDGASLLAGPPAEVVDPANRELAYKLRLRLDRIPEDRLTVTVEMRSHAWGAVATADYFLELSWPVRAALLGATTAVVVALAAVWVVKPARAYSRERVAADLAGLFPRLGQSLRRCDAARFGDARQNLQEEMRQSAGGRSFGEEGAIARSFLAIGCCQRTRRLQRRQRLGFADDTLAQPVRHGVGRDLTLRPAGLLFCR